MVLAVSRSAVRERHLTPVPGNGTGALADRRAAAEAAAAGPRQRVAELEAAMNAAAERADFAEAAALQEQLTPAREALAVASLELRLLDESQAEIERARQAAQRAVQEAQQRAQAQGMLDAALQAEQEALDATNAALGVMRSNLLAALAAYQEAARIEGGVLRARLDQVEARRRLGEFGRDPGPAVVGGSECQVLADRDALVKQLARWRP